MQSISAMPIYSDKSHEELRMEDYELHTKGGNAFWSGQSGFKHFDTKENIFSRPKAFNFSVASAAPTLAKPANTFSPPPYTFSPQSHSFQPQSTVASSISSFTPTFNSFSQLNPGCQQIPSNNHPFMPFSSTSTSPFNTISSNKQSFAFSPAMRSTLQSQSTITSTTTAPYQTPNPLSSLNPVTQSMTASNSLPSLSKTFTSPFNTISSSEPTFTFTPFVQSAFQPQNSVTSSMPSFTLSINPFSSLNPNNQSTTSTNCPLPKSSAVLTFPLFSKSEPTFTFSPSILSALEKALGPFSFLNASSNRQTVPNVNFPSISNLNETSLEQTAFTKVSQADGQNVSVQQYVSSSTGNEQLSCIQNPFGPQIEVNISNFQPNSRISIQTGISNIPVSNNPSAVRKGPQLRIRHLSSRHKRYHPAQRHNSGSKKLKVPFFCDTEDKPCVVAPLMPRMNPRSWVSNWSSLKENTPLTTRDNGAKSSENKAFATSSIQPEATSPEAAYEISFEEEHLDDLLPLLPKLRDGDYYTEPPIDLLAENERAEPGFCSHVRDFVVGRRDYGSIKFLGETDVRYLDLESIIQFNKREVIIYLNDLDKPPVGESLNKPAEVTLLNVKCIDKKTGTQYTDGKQVHRYRAMVFKRTEEIGAQFVSYDPVEGVWKFRVQHF